VGYEDVSEKSRKNRAIPVLAYLREAALAPMQVTGVVRDGGMNQTLPAEAAGRILTALIPSGASPLLPRYRRKSHSQWPVTLSPFAVILRRSRRILFISLRVNYAKGLRMFLLGHNAGMLLPRLRDHHDSVRLACVTYFRNTAVSIPRQSRGLYDYWPLKGAWS